MLGSTKQQQWVTNWLAKRYRVASDATNMLVSAAYLTAKEIKIDPLLILSVMAIESGLNPFAESPVGAQGLMQVMTEIHAQKYQKYGGKLAAFDPLTNMRVGVAVLQEYIRLKGGSVEQGLLFYLGGDSIQGETDYVSKVLAEQARLDQVAAGIKLSTQP